MGLVWRFSKRGIATSRFGAEEILGRGGTGGGTIASTEEATDCEDVDAKGDETFGVSLATLVFRLCAKKKLPH